MPFLLRDGRSPDLETYAEQLFKGAKIIVVARVIAVQTDPLRIDPASRREFTRESYADIQVTEHIKGPSVRKIRQQANGDCGMGSFVEGNERLFLLNESKGEGYVYYASPGANAEAAQELLPILRRLRDAAR